MFEQNKCCSDVREKHFIKDFAVTKQYDQDFENSTKRWIL